jgi:molybdopterin-guanine dinucleotide biosynthesis protein A
MTKHKINGLILVGGKSKRMGKNKSMIRYQNKPQWEISANTLSKFCHKVYISTQFNNKKTYGEYKTINDIFDNEIGPLNGIISALKAQPDYPLLVLACDLPLFDEYATKFLIENRNLSKIATYIYIKKDNPEPLCTIYEQSSLPILLSYWTKGIFCPRKILQKEDCFYIKTPNPLWVKNINNPQELKNINQEIKTHKKKIKIIYYASMKEEIGLSSEMLNTFSNTISDLYDEIKNTHNFSTSKKDLKIAINNSFVKWNHNISNNDTIIFIPPVAGG